MEQEDLMAETREELLDYFNRPDSNHRIFVELGVSEGRFSESIINRLDQASGPRVFSIDAWDGSRLHDTAQYIRACKRLSRHECSFVIRCRIDEALSFFENESIDFVYIDGYAHTGQEDGKTLAQWWPKVRTGGMFCGHDYHADWPKTIEAVDRFLKSIRRHADMKLTTDDKPPSWYLIK